MPGRIILDIPPRDNNPRNSEGVFIKLPDGTLMFAFSRFEGDVAGDDVSADIAAVYSRDKGETFGDETILFSRHEHDARNIMSTSSIWLGEDRLALFYAIRKGFHDTRLFMRISKDGGRTFDKGRYCMNHPGYFVTNNDRVVRLSNGRIFVPAAYHRCIGADPSDWKNFSGKGTARFFYSDDNGSTFREADDFGSLNVPTRTGLQEPGVIELEPGHLLCYCRTDLGSQYISDSYDYGNTWKPFMPSKFTSPVSPMSIKKIPGRDIYIAVYNPVPFSNVVDNPAGWGRTPLVLTVSTDGCRNFGKPVILEDNPRSGFCYPTMFFDEDYMLVSYCAGGDRDGACLNRVRIRKIHLEELGLP